MIRDDLGLVGLSLEVYLLMSKSFDDCEEFLIVNFVIEFGRGELP